MDFHHDQQASDILIFLRQQQTEGRNCDVILRRDSLTSSLEPNVPAHRCVLAANSGYFRALFDSGLRDSKVQTHLVPAASSACLQRVVQFLYSGDVTISWDDVEQTLSLADYLEMTRLVGYCGEFLRRNLSDGTCLKIKTLASTFNLTDVDDDVTNYITSRWSRLIRCDEIAELPGETLMELLRADGRTGFAREADVLEAVCKWARRQIDSHLLGTVNLQNDEDFFNAVLSAFDLLQCVEFRYLSKTMLRSKVVGCTDVTRWLSVRKPEVLRDIENALRTDIPRAVRDVCDVVLVRSRISTVGEQVRILVYVVELDEWRVWNVPGAPDARAASLHGLESMTVHSEWMYFICTVVEDMHGYLHKALEWKHLYRVNLETGLWETLRSPPAVRGQCRLVGTIDGLFAIDRSGVIDEYDPEDGRWKRTVCGTGFPGAADNATMCILPMPIDRKMYLLRTVSSGHSFEYAEKNFVLYLCDTLDETPRWSVISEIETNELFASRSTTTDDANFYGYSISPGLITLTDELGHPRAVYNLSTGAWTIRETKVPRPSYFCTADVYGSTVCGERVYCVARNQQLPCGLEPGADQPDKCNALWMFDNLRRRFKMTAQPPLCPSGLMCHVTLARATLEDIIDQSRASDRS